MTSHERAAITRSVKEICNLHDERVGTHEEAATRRIRRDEKDIESLVLRLTSEMMKNPFDLKVDKDTADIEPFGNITTGVVLPNKVVDRLINASSIGHWGMLRFYHLKVRQ